MVDFDGASSQQLAGRLKLRHLRFVLVLAEAGSLQGAADKLAVTYAAVVKTRQEIETVIGTPLLVGRGKAVALTPVAHAIHQRALRVLHELDCLGEEVVALRSGLCGQVTVGVRLSHALHWLAPALVDFHVMYPEVSMSMVDGLHLAVAEGAVDIGLGRAGSSRWHGRLEFTPIAPVRTVVVASGSVMAAVDAHSSWPDMLDHEWCLPPMGTPLRDRFDDFLRQRGFGSPKRQIEINDLNTHAELMRAGSFLGLCAEPTGSALEGEGVARIVHGPVPELDDHIALFWRADQTLRPVVRNLRNFLQQRAARATSEVADPRPDQR
ncbi:MAG: LysR family transcriptional regulator [Proteobacteria bacterium]|nr:LysR family transcriptional regulator [Pseudomonadota bacterium]